MSSEYMSLPQATCGAQQPIRLYNKENPTRFKNADCATVSDNSVSFNRSLFAKNTINGTVNGQSYSLAQRTNLVHGNNYEGTINSKPTSYNIKNSFSKKVITGTIGNEELNLSVSDSILGKTTITGIYKEQPVNFTISGAFNNKYITSDNTNLMMSSFLGNYSLYGEYNDDEDLLPVIMSVIEVQKQEEEEEAAEAAYVYYNM